MGATLNVRFPYFIKFLVIFLRGHVPPDPPCRGAPQGIPFSRKPSPSAEVVKRVENRAGWLRGASVIHAGWRILPQTSALSGRSDETGSAWARQGAAPVPQDGEGVGRQPGTFRTQRIAPFSRAGQAGWTGNPGSCRTRAGPHG